MGSLREIVGAFWDWVPKWQFYPVLVASVALWVVRYFALSKAVILVAAIAWFLTFVVSRTDMGKGIGTNALNFAMLGAGALAVILGWFFFIRKT